MWFNEEDDFEDVPAAASDLDNSISMIEWNEVDHFCLNSLLSFSR
jgi:hypothetical protein